MATFIETSETDAPLGSFTNYTLTQGDILQGSIVVDDTGDSANVALIAGQTYTFTLVAQNGGLEGSILSFSGPDQAGSASLSQDAFFTGAPLVLTFTAEATAIYTISVQSAGGIEYQLIFGAADMPAPALPSEGDDILTGQAGADVIDLLSGNDSFSGGNGSDRVFGATGNDTLSGDAGNDLLDGGADDDALFGGSGRDTLNGGDGLDLLNGGGGDDNLDGGAGDDTLVGGAGQDALIGDLGNDVLDGGADNDILTGGAGADIFVFRNGDGQDRITDFRTGIDQIDISATGLFAFSQLVLSDTSGETRLILGNGNFVELSGVSPDEITAADIILTAPPPPPMGSESADLLIGSLADELIDAGAGADVVRAGLGDDTVFGGTGEDRILGEGGDDWLDGGSGADSLFGGDGNDVIFGAASNDLLFGGDGADMLHGGADNDRLNGDAGNDTLIGEQGNDRLVGGDDHDLLDGGAGKDTLDGGHGNDTLAGGLGEDLMTGGAGADVFVFEDRMNNDRITDFQNGTDLLDFSAFGFASITDLMISQSGNATVIRVNAGNALTLDNIDSNLIDSSDFIFAPSPIDQITA
jgi:Ca2+-binding RTX toxin-like protein